MSTAATQPKELESQALALPEQARELSIRDQGSYDAAVAFLSVVKQMRQEIDRTFDPIISKAHAAHKEACEQKRRVEAPVVEAERIVKGAIGGFALEQKRLAEAEGERLRQEAEAQEQELRQELSLRVKAAGASEEEVRAIVESPSTAPPPVAQPSYEQDTRVSTRANWKAEVTDFKLLVKAASEKDELLSLLQANQTALNQLAKAMKEKMNVAGVRAYNDTVVSAKV